jgi:hypothetical protein
MNQVPITAIILSVGLLIVVWASLANMIMSQHSDAHLQLLLNLMGDANEPPKDAGPSRRSPHPTKARGMQALRECPPLGELQPPKIVSM